MNKLMLLLSLLILFACGPSAEEKARVQKEREDSIRLATKTRLENELALKEEIENLEAQVEGQSNRLSFFKSELEVQKDKLNTIKQPQFLRTPAEREQQIRDQVLIIEQTEKEIKNLQNKIIGLEENINGLKQDLKQYE